MSKILFTLLALLYGAWVVAEDIDIYSGAQGTSDRPNVLIILDNAANFSAEAHHCTYADGTAPGMNGKAGGIEQCALVDSINNLPVNADGSALINIGLMVYNKGTLTSGSLPAGVNTCAGTNTGGCLLWSLQAMTRTNQAALVNFIKTWGNSFDIKADSKATGSSIQEAWAYYFGGRGLSTMSYPNGTAKYGCQRNFIIFIGNAFNTSGTPGDGQDVATALATAGANTLQRQIITKPITLDSISQSMCDSTTYTPPSSAHENKGWYADEWTRFLNQVDGVTNDEIVQNVTTYTVGVLGDDCKPEYPALMTSMALYGGGRYFPTHDTSSLKAALNRIINEVLAVSTSFSAPTLPVTSHNQGVYLNQVYIGLFIPDGNGGPRWLGNLKHFQFLLDSNQDLYLADSAGEPATSSASGNLSPNAISFWTSSASSIWSNGFWVNNPLGSISNESLRRFDSPDGEVVRKGGAAQILRQDYNTSQTSRTMYTCLNCGSNPTLTAFNTSAAITTASLGAASDTERNNIINWLRGTDNNLDELGPGGTTTVRPSIHGDIVHSTPLATNANGSITVFYGDSHGVFHAVNGAQTTASGGGHERWSFIPEEFLGKIKRLRDNTPALKLFSTVVSSAMYKDYALDGPVGLYQAVNDTGQTTRMIVYLTARKGGRFLYALDVTSINSPTLLWRINNSTTGFSELGYTWSKPLVAKLKSYTSNPVIIFGAGYDPNQDNDSITAADTMGRGVYIVDAVTGSVVASFTAANTTGMSYSIPSDVTLVDRDYDGYVDKIYAVDTGGNVWRIDTEAGVNGVTRQAYLFAAVGGSSSTKKRKLLYPPEVVITKTFDAVQFVTGDREHPVSYYTNSQSVHNRFYMIKDTEIGKDGSNWTAVTDTTDPAGTDAPTGFHNSTFVADGGTDCTLAATDKGYYLDLANTGEKGVTKPLTSAGYTYFSTHQPTALTTGQCQSKLGIARSYSLQFMSGCPLSTTTPFVTFQGGGIAPSPFSGVVKIGDAVTPFIIGAGNPNSPGETLSSIYRVAKPPINLSGKRYRYYSYQEIDH